MTCNTFYLILGGGIRDAGRGMLLPLPCDDILMVPAMPPRNLMAGGLNPEVSRLWPPRTGSMCFTAVWTPCHDRKCKICVGGRGNNTQNHIMLSLFSEKVLL
jgi:hypothetical protein